MILSTFVKAFIIRIKFYYNDIFDHLETIYKRKLENEIEDFPVIDNIDYLIEIKENLNEAKINRYL